MFAMTDFPKYFTKDGKDKVAHNARQAVELRFAGYRQTEAPKTEEAAPAPSVGDAAVPQLTEAEMAKLPEAKDAEVVDTTEPEAVDSADSKPSEEELKANEAEKLADAQAYLANQKKSNSRTQR
jgi:hypothetical protein